ncbi:hypothetical protein ACP4OV_020910 [Aristida adscensionis]
MAQSPQESNGSATNTPSESQNDPLSELPRREGWSQLLFLYKNFWFLRYPAETIIQLQGSFNARPDDIILASNPKCGTTWLKAAAFSITNRACYGFDDYHPLLTHHPQELVPFIEIPWDGDLRYVETLPSPRLLSTHMPHSVLPNSVTERGCRIVYICRNPKDTFISWWHFQNKLLGPTDLDLAFSMFCEGFSPAGPFWDHCLEYWKQSIVRPDKVLFLKYDDMMAEPVEAIKKLAAFLGAPFTNEEEESGVPEEVVRLCSFEKLSGLEANKTGVVSTMGMWALEKSWYFRRGKVGDWVNYLSEEMASKFDCILKEKLKDLVLSFDVCFPYVIANNATTLCCCLSRTYV